MTLQLRLKQESRRQFFTTPTGYTIDKDHWENILILDRDIDFLLSRGDVEAREITEDINEMVTDKSSEKETFKESTKKKSKKSTKKKSKK